MDTDVDQGTDRDIYFVMDIDLGIDVGVDKDEKITEL